MAVNNQVAKRNSLLEQNKEIILTVENQIKEWTDNRRLDLPSDYSVSNAIRSALLILQETKDKNKNPVLEVCSTASIARALIYMAAQGLSPHKEQCYFIAHGTTLTLRRSYFGTRNVTLRLCPEVARIEADVVYAKDKFKYGKKLGRTVVLEHESELGNIQMNQIIAAYCSIFFKDGTESTTIMTIEQIKESWKMSQIHPINEDGSIKKDTTHYKFPDEMAKRTVTNRACKPLLNSSNDGSILSRVVALTEQDETYAEQREIIETKTASIPIEDYEIKTDTEVAEKIEAAAEPIPEPQIEEEPEVTEQIEIAEFDDDPGY